MRRLVFIALLLPATVAPLVPAASETGTVAGLVRLTTKIRGNPLPTSAYAPRAVSRHAPPATPEIRNVLVYLKGVDYRGALQVSTREIVQDHEVFVPRVLAVTKGSTVAFPNSDPIFHNVFSLSRAGAFDLGRYPKGQSRSRELTAAGLIKVFCHIHSQMSASIMVFDHPYYTAPLDDGTFELRGLPEGRYTVVGWHERVGERERTITVVPGQRASVELSLPVDSTP
jgi:plastocyanin